MSAPSVVDAVSIGGCAEGIGRRRRLGGAAYVGTRPLDARILVVDRAGNELRGQRKFAGRDHEARHHERALKRAAPTAPAPSRVR